MYKQSNVCHACARGSGMKSVLIAMVMFCAGLPVALAANTCAQLPSSLQNVSVNYINQVAELEKLDAQLEAHLQPCLQPINAENRKAVCTNGRMVAEQALRVMARVDEAGKKNALLANAKMRSYKTGVAVLEHMRKLAADRACH